MLNFKNFEKNENIEKNEKRMKILIKSYLFNNNPVYKIKKYKKNYSINIKETGVKKDKTYRF